MPDENDARTSPLLDDVANALGGLLTEVINEGATLPILIIAVAANESMFYGRYYDGGDYESLGGLDCEPLAEHIMDDNFAPPINMMLVEAKGAAYRAVIEPGASMPPRLLH